MDVDEAGHDHAAGPVNHGSGRAVIRSADVDKLAAIEGDIAALHVDVAGAGLIVGNDPVGVPDDGDGHWD
jgi:hypothetical protein